LGNERRRGVELQMSRNGIQATLHHPADPASR
jgi:hypothetical protein